MSASGQSGAFQPAAARVQQAFPAWQGRAASFIGRAPGRVNLIGEHIDYCGGCVLPMAIDRDCVAAAAPSSDGHWHIWATDIATGPAWRVAPTEALGWRTWTDTRPPKGDWRSYVAGVIAHTAELLMSECRPLAIAIASDVPLGAGLSSSAALEVSVCRVLHGAAHAPWHAHKGALACRLAEHEFAGVPCGIMDQLASAGATAGHAMMIDTRVGGPVRHIPIGSGVGVIVMNTGVRHAHAGGEYTARVRGTRAAAAKLGVQHLVLADEERLRDRGLSDEEHRLARHAITEQRRVGSAGAALASGDARKLGALMNESHASLRDDFRVSCAELDVAVACARDCPGVYGARMTGGGFGGCAIALVDLGAQQAALDRLRSDLRRAGLDRSSVFAVQPADGASLLPA